MATVTGLTKERMQEIIDATIVDADVVGDNLILTKEDGSTIDAGNVRGPAGTGGSGGGITKAGAFPVDPAPTDGDLVIRIDQAGDPIYKFTDGAWLPLIDVLEGWHTVGSGGTEPPFQNAAVAIRPIRFRRGNGFTRLEAGSYIQGPANVALFTLPAGYRPPYDVNMWGIDNTGAQVKLTVLATGVVQTSANKSSGGWVDLGNLRFDHA